jgi:hypothetical protein
MDCLTQSGMPRQSFQFLRQSFQCLRQHWECLRQSENAGGNALRTHHHEQQHGLLHLAVSNLISVWPMPCTSRARPAELHHTLVSIRERRHYDRFAAGLNSEHGKLSTRLHGRLVPARGGSALDGDSRAVLFAGNVSESRT